MESERFDGMVRRLASATDRRTTVKGLAVALTGVGVVRAAAPAAVEAEEVETEKCGGKRDKCFRNTDCCKGLKCKNDGRYDDSGTCVFKNGHGDKGDWCKKDSDCDNRYECRNKRCK
jgi:hypothetical protein